MIERAYVRGLKEGMRRGEGRRRDLVMAKQELGIRFKTALGEVTRLKIELEASRELVAAVRSIIAVEWGENQKSIDGDTEFEGKVRAALAEYERVSSVD